MAKEFILLGTEQCAACRDLKEEIGDSLSANIREVDAATDEGAELGVSAWDQLADSGIPAVLEKDGDKIQVCKIERTDGGIIAKCPSGDQALIQPKAA